MANKIVAIGMVSFAAVVILTGAAAVFGVFHPNTVFFHASSFVFGVHK